ncbi:MAG TPA: hypothetical protein VGQ02_02870 [Candidatus Limnocylindrales bacterium]|nr:hypothetical protein [Candidatus Limnocylindrales bacterium]
MGPANPWSPNWRPDPTGRRLIAIRSSRRGALWAGVLLWPLVLLAAFTTPGAMDLPDVRQIVLIAALSWPGLALLGAGLAPAALGSRIDAIVAGIALGIGAPIAAITSILIGIAIIALVSSTGAGTGAALGLTIRLGVLGAIRFAPLVAIAVTIWIVVVRQRRVSFIA